RRMPQHAKRIKIRRKALRQPDEFETLTGQAVNWASANRGLVTGVVAALAVAGLAAVAVGHLRGAERERASLAFRTAHTTFAAGNKFTEAAEAFAALAPVSHRCAPLRGASPRGGRARRSGARDLRATPEGSPGAGFEGLLALEAAPGPAGDRACQGRGRGSGRSGGRRVAGTPATGY